MNYDVTQEELLELERTRRMPPGAARAKEDQPEHRADEKQAGGAE